MWDFDHVDKFQPRYFPSNLTAFVYSILNSLWPGDIIWSTLVEVMAWCLAAPSHYLNQCWLIICKVLWHSPGSNFTRIVHELNLEHMFRDYTFKITTFPRSQWVNHCGAKFLSMIQYSIELMWTRNKRYFPTWKNKFQLDGVVMDGSDIWTLITMSVVCK